MKLKRLLSSIALVVISLGTSGVGASEVAVRNLNASYFDSSRRGDGVSPPRQTAATGVVSQTATIESLGSGGRGIASADLGVLRSSSTASAVGVNSSNGGSDGFASLGRARADASWYDLVTVAGAGLSGAGLANMRFFVDGSVTNDGVSGLGGNFSGNASADFGLRVSSVLFTFNTQAVLTHLGTDFVNTFTRVNNVDYAGSLGGYWDLIVPITFGQAFGIEAVITTSASTLAGANSTVNSFSNFGNSIYWGGITSITLASGATTTDFSALGDTAHDWKVSAVPEPETYAMMLAGLGLVGAIARRRKAKQTA